MSECKVKIIKQYYSQISGETLNECEGINVGEEGGSGSRGEVRWIGSSDVFRRLRWMREHRDAVLVYVEDGGSKG